MLRIPSWRCQLCSCKKTGSLVNLTVTSVAGNTSGSAKITVEPILTSGNSYKYKTAANPVMPEYGILCRNGYTNWDGISEIMVTEGQKLLIAEVDRSGRCAGAGIAEAIAEG